MAKRFATAGAMPSSLREACCCSCARADACVPALPPCLLPPCGAWAAAGDAEAGISRPSRASPFRWLVAAARAVWAEGPRMRSACLRSACGCLRSGCLRSPCFTSAAAVFCASSRPPCISASQRVRERERERERGREREREGEREREEKRWRERERESIRKQSSQGRRKHSEDSHTKTKSVYI